MAKTNHKPTSEAPVEVEKPKFELDNLMEKYKTKSAVIRFLSGEGWTRSQIATFMNIRYQHVRNVLIQPLKQPTEPAVSEAVEVQ